jgi:23S rRNA (guanine745-N1)-methyltransferase
VASSYHLPFDDGCFDALIDVFSPRPFDELLRVVRPGGVAIVVTPGPHHLAQLKALVYDSPRPHVDDEPGPAAERVDHVRFAVDLAEPVLRRQLLEMTPYWWSAAPARRQRIETQLAVVDVDVVLSVYRCRVS